MFEEDTSKSAHMIRGSFAVKIKYVETKNPIFKARFLAHGNRDSEKDQLVHNSTIAKFSPSTRSYGSDNRV